MVKTYGISIHFTGMYETAVRATNMADAQEIAKKRLQEAMEYADIDYSQEAIVTGEAIFDD